MCVDADIKLKELSDYVLQVLDNKDIDTLKDDNMAILDWDYILIDEAQDWKKAEKILSCVCMVQRDWLSQMALINS